MTSSLLVVRPSTSPMSLPRDMTSTRSLLSITSSSSDETMTTPTPLFAKSSSTPKQFSLRADVYSARVGSSTSKTSIFIPSHFASTFCWFPPDKVRASRLSAPFCRPSRSVTGRARHFAPRESNPDCDAFHGLGKSNIRVRCKAKHQTLSFSVFGRESDAKLARSTRIGRPPSTFP